MSKTHVCERFHPVHRGQRRCRYCGKVQYQIGPGLFRPSMSLAQFGNNWLPTVSGTGPIDLMRVDVAFPFEWNCYESWNVVYRVTFTFPEVEEQLGSRVYVLNGWTSSYQEDFVRIDADARKEYEARTGRPYVIGDNAYEEMRRVIQS